MIPRPLSRALLPLLALVALWGGCGKRADPLPPYLKTPAPPSALVVAQVGEQIEIRAVAPRTTTQNRPLPVIELEWLQAPPLGDFGKTAESLFREEVAPGEPRTKRFPRPRTDVRVSVRAISGQARSAPAPPFHFKPAPVPASPSGLLAVNTPSGVELQWTNPPGAEPWPKGTPPPSALSSPLPSPPTKPSVPPVAGLPSPPSSSPAKIPPAVGSPSPSPSPSPGIRLYRTDQSPRLVQEALQASHWVDATVKHGETACYSLGYATSLTPLVESSPSEPVCVEVKDLVPPDPPGPLYADLGTNFVELSWSASPSADTTRYRVYRSVPDHPRTLVMETDGPSLRVKDLEFTQGPRTYVVVAVDAAGNESLPGPPATVVLP